MTKDEFFKMRDEMRAKGLLESKPLQYTEEILNDYEIAEALKMLGNQEAAIFKTSGFGRNLKFFVDYHSSEVLVKRVKVDELDNLHITRVK